MLTDSGDDDDREIAGRVGAGCCCCLLIVCVIMVLFTPNEVESFDNGSTETGDISECEPT